MSEKSAKMWTNLLDNLVADTLSEMVNTTKRLSGTLATITPIKNRIASIQ